MAHLVLERGLRTVRHAARRKGAAEAAPYANSTTPTNGQRQPPCCKADAVPALHLYPSSSCGVAHGLCFLGYVEVIEGAPVLWPPLRRVIQATDQVKG